jgi:hypothetical protein
LIAALLFGFRLLLALFTLVAPLFNGRPPRFTLIARAHFTSATLVSSRFDPPTCVLALLGKARSPSQLGSRSLGAWRVGPSSGERLAALVTRGSRPRLLARLAAPVLYPALSLITLSGFSLVVIAAGGALSLVPIPVLLLIAVPVLVLAVVVAVIALAVIAIPVVALPVMVISPALGVSAVVIAVIAPENPRIVIDTTVGIVGITATRQIVVVVPTAEITVTVAVAVVRVVPEVGVHRTAVIR